MYILSYNLPIILEYLCIHILIQSGFWKKILHFFMSKDSNLFLLNNCNCFSLVRFIILKLLRLENNLYDYLLLLFFK